MMDEGTDPLLHRWRSFARLLMEVHPRVGAAMYALSLGDRLQYRVGWNVIHPSRDSDKGVRYTLVKLDDGKHTPGKHTPNKPDVPDYDMNHVYEDDTPQLIETQAWARMLELSDLLAKRDHPELPAEFIRATQQSIEVASLTPLRGDAKEIEQALSDALGHMQAVLARGSASVADLVAPVLSTVRSYMSFECDGEHAANVLARLLWSLSTVFPSPLSTSTDADRALSSSDHLRDLTFSLLRDRSNKTLASFSDMTYLALLYGNVSLILYSDLLESETSRPKDKEMLGQRRLLVDEQLAHEAMPSLVHPAWYCPFGLAESFIARPEGTESALYPGARVALERGETDPKKRWNVIEEFSARASAVSLIESLNEINHPLAPTLRKHLMGFLVAYKMGGDG